jgi:hypothetical protein
MAIKVSGTREKKKPIVAAPRKGAAGKGGAKAGGKPPALDLKPTGGLVRGRQVPPLTVVDYKGNADIRIGDIPVGVVVKTGSDQVVEWLWKSYRSGHSPSREEAEARGIGASWSLVDWCIRQWAWSDDTFGPGLKRTNGIIEHIRKELREVQRDPQDLEEWIDVMILAMDGFRRHGGTPRSLIEMLDAKQVKNFARSWPDWRKLGDDVAIEHDRSQE